MWGLISAGISLAGAGMSAFDALKAGKDMKKAQAAGNNFINQYASGKGVNALAGLQAPDISSLSYQQNQQALSQVSDTLSQSGAEGAIGGAANVLQSVQQNNLETAQRQAEVSASTQEKILRQQQAIEDEAFARQKEAQAWKAGNEQAKYNQAVDARMAGIQGLVGGVGNAIGFARQDFNPTTGQYDKGRWYAENMATQNNNNQTGG